VVHSALFRYFQANRPGARGGPWRRVEMPAEKCLAALCAGRPPGPEQVRRRAKCAKQFFFFFFFFPHRAELAAERARLTVCAAAKTRPRSWEFARAPAANPRRRNVFSSIIAASFAKKEKPEGRRRAGHQCGARLVSQRTCRRNPPSASRVGSSSPEIR